MQDRSKNPLRASLRELSLHSAQPAALASFYERALGYHFEEDGHGLIGVAPGRRLRVTHGPAKTLDYAAYAVADADVLDGLRDRLSANGCLFDETSWPGFVQNILRCTDPDGNRFMFGLAEADHAPAEGATALRPARLQHVVVATTQPERLLDFYLKVLNFTLSDRVVDEAGEMRTAFVRCGRDHHDLALFLAPENRLDHHCLEAGDWMLIRDWCDHFADERIPLKWGPGRHGPGNNLFVFIHDIDGNWTEISAELEVVDADRPVGDWPHEERTLNSWGAGLLRS